ncbi:MAG TPA: NfeD family protein [Candidatus Ozemobacteraceae bacterium]|nr:NfeD family protein [Candidatus Ozemobacteraceae bacterium]
MRSLLPILSVILSVFLFTAPAGFAQELSGGEMLPRLSSETPGTSGQPGHTSAVSTSDTASTSADSDGNSSSEPGAMSYSMIVLIMLLGGLILLFIEVALIPGFGITGVTGIVVILAGLGLSFWKLDMRLAVLYSFSSLAALIGLVFWAVYVFPHTSMGKKFVLQAKISVEDGYTATRDLEKYIGMEGIATSDLRPSGIARIGEERLDVLADGEYVPRQSKIKVLRVKNGALIVGMIQQPAENA